MAPPHSFLYFLSLVLTYLTPFVLGAPWIATDYFQEVPEEVYGDYDTSKHQWSIVTSTTYEEIIPTATSLPEAIRTNVVVQTDYYAGTATLVEKLYPSGAVGTPVPYSLKYGYQDNGWTSTIWVVNLTYSAPTACSTQWTTTTAVSVTPPQDRTFDRLLPTTAASTSYSVYNAEGFQSSTYFYKYIWVAPTQVPTSSMNRLSDEYYPATLYNNNDKDCRYENHGYEYSGNGYYYGDYYNDGLAISPLAILLICVLGWIVLWFLLGILEAWIRFRRLMTGWQTRRGMPVCWALTIMPLTLFCLCCFRRGYRARTAHDSAVLQSRWKKMTAWRKFVLFWKWGFRYKYPTILGPAPERVMPSKRPGKHPGSSMGPPLLYSTPPQTAVYPPVSPVTSLNREAVPGGPGPQMSQAMPMHQHPLAPVPAPQPNPEASGALQSVPEHGHEQQQPQTETEAPVQAQAQAQTETEPQSETQPQHQNPTQGGEVGRAH
ncbi:hypothetical protein PEBR_20010 [Penicillium brasilianum]|uniref:Uncharacterized protein n=1 Tax=Penicillium brasilianum TaxID=104259 RepID=A0A1S9RN40_PENBI|nr:hypothetical protein PEBR_20010 [Penicillium brasilianum]